MINCICNAHSEIASSNSDSRNDRFLPEVKSSTFTLYPLILRNHLP